MNSKQNNRTMLKSQMPMSFGVVNSLCFHATHSWKIRRLYSTEYELEEDFPGLKFYENSEDVNAFLFESNRQ